MSLETQLDTPLALAVRAAGSQSAFGRIISRRQSTIRDWLRLGKPLPAEYVFAVERATGVSRHVLRPDLYPDDHVGRVSAETIKVACDRAPILDRGAHG